MKSILTIVLLFASKVLCAQSYPFFALANGGVVMSDKPGILTLTDSTVSVIVDGSTDKPVVWKVISREGEVYKYNGGEFKISKESGKVDGQKFNTLIYQTMPNGLGGTLTLKYVCLIKK
jgi:hypothetical protein